MKTNNCSRENLLKFYFGTLNEAERLQIEKELLYDPEILLDYLDLKRRLELANEVPQQPSAQFWRKLAAQAPRKSFALSFALGLAVATLAGLFFYLQKPEIANPPESQTILFDSGSEQSFAAGVL